MRVYQSAGTTSRRSTVGKSVLLAIALSAVTALLSTGVAQAAPDAVVLSPKTATKAVQSGHTLTATVTDHGQAAPANTYVLLQVKGANGCSDFCTRSSGYTDSTGKASILTYGYWPGTDDLRAVVDLDNDFIADSDEPSDTASVTWTVAASDSVVLEPE